MKTLTYFSFFLFWSLSQLSAQSDELNMIVSVKYENVELGEALKGLSKEYHINFSYSRRFIPLDVPVYCNVSKEPLYVALDEMFANVAISYASIGDQIVLRVDKEKRIGQLEKELEDQYNPAIYDEIVEIEMAEESIVRLVDPELTMPSIPDQMELENEMIAGLEMPFDQNDFTPTTVRLNQPHEAYKRSPSQKLKASFSVVPKVGASVGGTKDAPTNTSVNLLWGRTENIEGFEFGFMVNTVTNDVEGVQAAGFFNVVKNDLDGVQMSGIGNVIEHDLKGVQFGGIINKVGGDVNRKVIHKDGNEKLVSGFQIAGIANRVTGNLDGSQFAGISNRVGGNSSGLQFAAIANKSHGDASVQISGFYNRAGYVKKTQLGLINVCDSIAGTSIGLINIVKGGSNSYNRIEISGGTELHVNATLKFGSRRFYNQVKIGKRFNNGHNTWAFGYGLGTTLRMNPKAHFNFELMTMHVNEEEPWTNTLNMLNAIQITYDHKIADQLSFFVGPSFNFMFSEREDAEGNLIGSQIAPYAIKLDPNSADRDAKIFWVGFNAGFRF